MAQGGHLRKPPRPLALLFLVSLGLRSLAWAAVVAADVPPVFDESGYFVRAAAIREVVVAWGRFEAPPADAWDRAYGHGHWPPLHPLALAAGMTLGGPSVAAARAVTVALSALTTVLVYLLARRTGGRRAALAAGWLHALYPTFVAYSHYLWSETTTVFLLLAALLAVAKLGDTAVRRRRLATAAAAGALLGLTAASHAAMLAMLPAVALWLAWRRRLADAGAVLAAGLLVLLPWLLVLRSQEGRFVPLSTLGGYNLALGNHADVPPGLGSSWGHEAGKARLRAVLEEAARRRSIGWEEAAYGVAAEEVRRRPGAAAVRALERLRMLWAPDFFPSRHLFAAVYPPLPPTLALGAAALAVAAYLGFLALAAGGLATDRLAAVCLAAGMALPAVSIANSRLHLPLLALLLPAAGRTLAGLLAGRWRPRPAAASVWTLVAVLALTSVPRVVEHYLLPSAWYAALARFGASWGAEPELRDRVVLRRLPGSRDDLEVEVVSAGARFADGSRRRPWPGAARKLGFDLVSPAAGEPPAIAVRSASGGRGAELGPLSPATWREWRDAGVAGVEVQWSGAVLRTLRPSPKGPVRSRP